MAGAEAGNSICIYGRTIVVTMHELGSRCYPICRLEHYLRIILTMMPGPREQNKKDRGLVYCSVHLFSAWHEIIGIIKMRMVSVIGDVRAGRNWIDQILN